MDNPVAGIAVVVYLSEKKIVIVLQVFWKFMCSYTILRNFVDG